MVSKKSGNVNRCTDEIPFINKMGHMEHDMLALRKIKKECEDVIGESIDILY